MYACTVYNAADEIKGKLMPAVKSEVSKNLVESLLRSDRPISGSITDVLKEMQVNDMRVVGPVARRGDIPSAVAKYNLTIPKPIKVTQSKIYLFHPDTGTTLQNCVLLVRLE